MRTRNFNFLSAWEDEKYERKSKRNLYGQNDAELACIKSQSRSYASKVSRYDGCKPTNTGCGRKRKAKTDLGWIYVLLPCVPQNPDTDIMLKAFEINTEELDEYLGATGQ